MANICQHPSTPGYAAVALQPPRLFVHPQMDRSQLESILACAQDGVIVVDPEGLLVLTNPAAGSIFGVDPTRASGRPASVVFQQPDLLEMVRRQDHPVPSHREISLEDGRVFNAHGTPIPGVGLAIFLQEITHLKELDRIKSDFVNTVSHDLRSPLTAILGYVELIDRVGPVTSQQGEYLRRVQANVHSITALINDLLDLGRIEAGFDCHKEVVYLPEIIGQTLDNLRDRIAEKGLALVLDIPSAMAAVLGNPVRLRQMLANLIDNAIKYTPSHGLIRLTAETEAGQVILQVADSGPGIPLADQPHLFDKFYRASNAPLSASGTGLGLAIVKSIVDHHQGRVWVESFPGRGSTFTIMLPILS